MSHTIKVTDVITEYGSIHLVGTRSEVMDQMEQAIRSGHAFAHFSGTGPSSPSKVYDVTLGVDLFATCIVASDHDFTVSDDNDPAPKSDNDEVHISLGELD